MNSATLRTRTWPVFLVGVVSLLGLLFLPGIVALRKTATVYLEIQRIQDSHRQTQRLLSEIERRVHLIGIAVRDALLETSASNSEIYERNFERHREEIEQELAALKRQPVTDNRVALPKLEQELGGYFRAVQPVFDWTPAERRVRATYFLREQQRPRRQSIIEIAEEISRLTEASYSGQLEQVNRSQIQFGEDIQRIIAAAFLIGVVIAAVTIVRMMTLEERADRHRARTEKTEEELRSLSTKLMHAQEEERRTISRELHDEVGQTLTGLRMGLAGLERVRDNPGEFHEQAGVVRTLAEQAFRSVRDIAAGLRPSVLDLGLVPAVQWQARQFARIAGVPATVHAEGDVEQIPEEYRTCIYRVVQECLTNAAKHAGATSVRIEIREADRALHVTIRDDGKGFRRDDGAGGGLGLIGMEERVRELGGSVRLESLPETGTTVSVHLTLPPLHVLEQK